MPSKGIGATVSAIVAALLLGFAGTAGAQPEPEPADEIAFERFGAFLVDPADPGTIYLNGAIEDAALLDFRRARRNYAGASTMVLNSPGGLVRTALAIADEAFEAGMTTVIPSWAGCYSSCAYIFLAGVERIALGELGVHQFSSSEPDIGDAQRVMADLLEMLGRFETPQALITIMLRTPPEEMYVFATEEIAELSINRGFADGADAFELAGERLPDFVPFQEVAADAVLIADPDGRRQETTGEARWRLGTDSGAIVAVADVDLDNGDAVSLVFGGPLIAEDYPAFFIGLWADSDLLNGDEDRQIEVVLIKQTGQARETLSSFAMFDYDAEEDEFFLGSLQRWLALDLSALEHAEYIEFWFSDGSSPDAVLRVAMDGDVAELLSVALEAWNDEIAGFAIGDAPELEVPRLAYVYDDAGSPGIEAEAIWYRSADEIAVRLNVTERDLLIDLAFAQHTIFILVQPSNQFADGPDAIRGISVDNDLRWEEAGAGLFVADLVTADPRRMAALLGRQEGIELQLQYASGEVVEIFVDKGASFDQLLTEIAAIWEEAPDDEPAVVAQEPAPAAGGVAPAAGKNPNVPPPTPMPDYQLSPTFGEVTLAGGFFPDPHRVGLQSGGPIHAAAGVGSSCYGYISEAPDYRLYYTPGDYILFISVVSEFDTTLVVNDPAGNWHCDDDSGGNLNPAIEWDSPLGGQYDIWVGTYSTTAYRDADLYISEIGPGANPGDFAGPDDDDEFTVIATYRDWEVLRDSSGVCFLGTLSMETVPTRLAGTPAYFFIEVNPQTGETFSTVSYDNALHGDYYVSAYVDGGRAFDFVAITDYAELFGRSEEQALVAAMQRGIRMEVASVTDQDVDRWDAFSLLGFTASLQRARADCVR
jgi:hypothetical protein